jgi:hypothetical protein
MYILGIITEIFKAGTTLGSIAAALAKAQAQLVNP